jgi:cellulose synthase (UDP-forming)
VAVLPDLAPLLTLLGLAALVLPSLDRDRGWGRVVVMVVSVLLILHYLVWRLTSTLPALALQPASLWMWGLAVMETLALGNVMLTALFLTRRSNRSGEADAGEQRLRDRAVLPAIDIIIPSYNEPLEVVERTILGAMALDWPDLRVWVLDDGNRPWLADYCASKGARWMARTGKDGGKAGNVNAWLAASRAEAAPYVMVLDADFVPRRNFLWRVLGLFDDDRVALVQTPQSFFNPDPIQLNLLATSSLADEQRFFFHDFQPALDAWGASFCVGTSFVARRDRIDAIGGIPTCTVTEDMMTTYALAARGWRTLYLDEKLSSGMAAEGLAEFINQRARWCLGTVQALRSPLAPWRLSGLNWGHRLCFLNAQLFWLASVPLMLLATLAPAVFWWTGTPAFLADPAEFIAHFALRFAAEAIALGWVSRWRVVPLLSGIAPLVVAPSAIAAALRAIFRPHGHRFSVTLKGGDRSKVVVHRRPLMQMGALMAATGLGMLVGQIPDLAPMGGGQGTAMNLIWSAYALLMLFLAMLVCVELPRQRREDRLPVHEDAAIDGAPAALLDLSLGGACVHCETPPPEAAITLSITAVGDLPARIIRRDGKRLFIQFTVTGAMRDALVRKLFSGTWATPISDPAPMQAIKGIVRRSFLSKV